MTGIPNARPRDGALPFRYVGGDPSLDLVNTVDWTDTGLQHERLSDYERLTLWAEGAGVLPHAAGRRLRHLASRDARGAAAALRRAWRLRGVLRRLFAGVAAGPRGEDGAAADEFASLLRGIMKGVRLERAGGAGGAGGAGSAKRRAWAFPDSASALEGFLSQIVWSAARLLTSPEADSLRVCAGSDCGWVFVDRSRNGLRRWCEMRTCGTLEKTQRRLARSRRRAT
jgi:predicted RNA-binding Zn ribbon-like protein